jgi:hypothetical protein
MNAPFPDARLELKRRRNGQAKDRQRRREGQGERLVWVHIPIATTLDALAKSGRLILGDVASYDGDVREFIEDASGRLGRRDTPRPEPQGPALTKAQREDAIRYQRKRGKIVTASFHLTRRAVAMLVSAGHIHPGELGDRAALSGALLEYLDWCLTKPS